jgi:hypothetical protein
MSVRALLDDAAAEATAGLQIDLAAAHRQADERRRLSRMRATAAMATAVAIAAVITLIAVLMPGAASRLFSPVPPAAPVVRTGLPDHWYYTPPWTPPVTRHHMPAASMMLAAPLQLGWSDSRQDGPVLVSADGTDYASVPWGPWDGQAALAPSGRDVAWRTQGDGSQDAPRISTVHRIRLSDGRRQDVSLPKGARAGRLLWEADRLVVEAAAESKSSTVAGWELLTGADSLRPLRGLPLVFDEPVMLGHGDPNGDPNHPGGDAIVSSFQVNDPEGRAHVELRRNERPSDYTGKPQKASSGLAVRPFALFTAEISAKATFTNEIEITGADPITDVQVLGWAKAGIVIRVHSRDRKYGNEGISLRIVPTDGRPSRIVSRRGGTLTYPVAIAADVVGDGSPIPGVEPTFPDKDRSHLRYLAVQFWFGRRTLWLTLLAAGFGAVVLFVVLLVRRRRSSTSVPGLNHADESPFG